MPTLSFLSSLLPARALSETLLCSYCACCRREKERCESSRWLSNLQLCYDNCIADVSTPNDQCQ